ncbi:MAG: hypothetical protein KAT32_04200 [Candidatus Moranbacteria bacterium]|nr:hypothetical protein [Candidatus Moranbacteria bacterium]
MKTPLSRRIFFYTLACSCIIITTAVMLSVFGYRFDFVRTIWLHHGSLTVKSNPQDVQIKVNGKTPKSWRLKIINDSYQINGLPYGNHDVEIIADGFKSWTKSVSIHSGISTELWNVLLVRENYERTSFNVQNIDNFFPAPEEFVFAYTSQKNSKLEINIINTEDNEIQNQIVLENTKFTTNKYENIEWSPASSSIIIPVIRQIENKEENGKTMIEAELDGDLENENFTNTNVTEEFKDYVIFNLKTDSYFYLSEKILIEENTENLMEMENENSENVDAEKLKKTISAVRWHPKDKESIYFLSDEKLYLTSFDLKNSIALKREEIYPKTLAYDFADDGIYILNKDNQLLYDDNFKATKLKEIIEFKVDENKNTQYRLISYDKNRVVLLNNQTGDCYLYNKGEKGIYSVKLGTGIIGVHFSNDGKKLVYYSNSEIFVYFTRIWEDQPNREENETKLITRSSKKISNVHFSKDYEHVIFSSGNEIKIIEMDTRGKSNPQTITSFNVTSTKIISDHRNNVLFFIDKNTSKINSLFQINFPEENPLF